MLAFERAVVGRRVLGAARRGKFLWLPLDDGHALTAHLGMSGQLLVRTVGKAGQVPGVGVDASPYLAPAGAPRVDMTARSAPDRCDGARSARSRHLRVSLDLTDPQGREVVLDLVDQRVFGGLHVCPLLPTSDGAAGGEGTRAPLVPATVSHVARDLLDPCLDQRALVARVRSSRRGIKAVLMDQTVVSGVGNIYADEGLWAAGLHARRRSCDLGPRVVGRLLTCTEEVMRRALEVGGTSFDALYVNADGEAGYFARSLAAYGRAGQPCQRCGTELRRETIGGRSHTFCPRCQTRPRGGV